jgi:hypothetical protein
MMPCLLYLVTSRLRVLAVETAAALQFDRDI